MTEQEALIRLDFIRCALLGETYPEIIPNEDNVELMDNAIKALEEVQQYRAIGTPEECRATVEKHKEIKPKELKNIYPSGQYECPVCGYCVGKHKYFKSTPLGETLANCKMEFNYCPDCGQKLDWSDEE